MERFLRTRDQSARAELIEQHARRLSAVIEAALGPGFLQTLEKRADYGQDDDIRSAARLGIIRAVDTFDPSRCSFRTWLAHCVRSEVRDELRALAPIPRGPCSRGVQMQRLDDEHLANGHEAPTHRIDDMHDVRQLLARTDARTRDMVELHFLEHLPMQYVGLLHGVNESRVSQIIGAWLRRARRVLKGDDDG